MEKHHEDKWTETISSENDLWNLQLQEVWHYRDLVRLFVWRDFIASYKQTILGPVWLVLNPLMNSVLYTVLLGILARFSTEGVPPFLFQLCSISLWSYFIRIFSSTQSTFTSNSGIFSKVYFPRLVVPVSSVLSNLIQLAILMGLFLISFALYKFSTNSPISMNIEGLLVVPFILVISSLLAVGTGAFTSTFTTKYRDFGFFVGYAIQFVMYSSAVVFPLSSMPYQEILLLNPLVSLMEAFRYAFLGIGSLHWGYLMYSFVFSLVSLLIGIMFFNRTARDFVDTV